MKLYKNTISVILTTGFLFAISFSASALVTFDIVTSDVFEGRITGPLNDIYWEGGVNDSPLTDFYSPTVTGLNTIGSSGVILNYDNFTNFNILGSGFATGNTVYDAPLRFGGNSVSSVSRDAEIIGFGDGLAGIPQASPVSSNTVTINRNNTYSYSNIISEDANYLYNNSSINAYSLAAGQNAGDIFLNADASIFGNSNLFDDIDPQRLANHFDYISGVVAPDWTALTFEFFQYTATAKDPNVLQNFVGVANYSYVSYDDGAIAQDSVSVPEPTSFLLMGLGLLGLTYTKRRKNIL
jgi:hypothetical protein